MALNFKKRVYKRLLVTKTFNQKATCLIQLGPLFGSLVAIKPPHRLMCNAQTLIYKDMKAKCVAQIADWRLGLCLLLGNCVMSKRRDRNTEKRNYG